MSNADSRASKAAIPGSPAFKSCSALGTGGLFDTAELFISFDEQVQVFHQKCPAGGMPGYGCQRLLLQRDGLAEPGAGLLEALRIEVEFRHVAQGAGKTEDRIRCQEPIMR